MRVLLAVVLTVLSALFSGKSYPTDFFRSPVAIPILLSGSFGETRSTHFHSGLDIRTNGREGYRIYASGDGFVSRIRVSPGGLGHALYVQHPNGYTTVYGHLQRFNDQIGATVRNAQYDQRRFDIELFPDPSTFPVSRGDVIAISGNTGSSGGPHLHFEIRDTRTEWPINPLLFGIPLKDTQPPQIRHVKLYARDHQSFAVVRMSDGRSQIVTFQRPLVLATSGTGRSWKLSGVDRIDARGDIAFGVEIRDTHDGSGFRLGAFRVRLHADDGLLFGQQLETFSFDQSRHLRAHLDVEEHVRRKRWIERSYLLPGNPIEIYLHQGDGWLTVQQDAVHRLRYEIEDAHGNTSSLPFRVGWAAEMIEIPFEPVEYATIVPQGRPHAFTNHGIALTFPPQTLYDDLPLRYQNLGTATRGFSDIHEVQDQFTPVNEAYSLSIAADRLPERLRDRAVIALQDPDRPDRLSSVGGLYDNGYVTTRTRSFGRFFVTADTVAPRIRPLNIGQGRAMRTQTAIRLQVDDELSGISSYEGYVNDQWVLFAYDPKRNLLEYTFDDHVGNGRHQLRFTARDGVGNEATYTVDFTR